MPKRIGAECDQVCAETMTGCGDLFVEAAQNEETVLPVGKCFFCPNADNSSFVFVATSVVRF
jgi:hypothetical protein